MIDHLFCDCVCFYWIRYDCRGALSDLTPYIANSSNFDPWIGFTPEERKIEQLCDKERYRALTSNEEEENIYQGNDNKTYYFNVCSCIIGNLKSSWYDYFVSLF